MYGYGLSKILYGGTCRRLRYVSFTSRDPMLWSSFERVLPGSTIGLYFDATRSVMIGVRSNYGRVHFIQNLCDFNSKVGEAIPDRRSTFTRNHQLQLNDLGHRFSEVAW